MAVGTSGILQFSREDSLSSQVVEVTALLYLLLWTKALLMPFIAAFKEGRFVRSCLWIGSPFEIWFILASSSFKKKKRCTGEVFPLSRYYYCDVSFETRLPSKSSWFDPGGIKYILSSLSLLELVYFCNGKWLSRIYTVS